MRQAIWLILVTVVLPNVLMQALGLVVFTSRAWVNLDYFLVAAAAAAAVVGVGVGVGALRVLLPVALLLDVAFSIAPAWHFSVESAVRSLADIFHLPPAYWLGLALGGVAVVVLVSEGSLRLLRSLNAQPPPPLVADSGLQFRSWLSVDAWQWPMVWPRPCLRWAGCWARATRMSRIRG